MLEFNARTGDRVDIRLTWLVPGGQVTDTVSGVVLALNNESGTPGAVTEVVVTLDRKRGPREIVRVAAEDVRRLIVITDGHKRCHICGTSVVDKTRCSACSEVRAHIIGRPMIAKSLLKALEDERVTEPTTEVKVGLTAEAF